MATNNFAELGLRQALFHHGVLGGLRAARWCLLLQAAWILGGVAVRGVAISRYIGPLAVVGVGFPLVACVWVMAGWLAARKVK